MYKLFLVFFWMRSYRSAVQVVVLELRTASIRAIVLVLTVLIATSLAGRTYNFGPQTGAKRDGGHPLRRE